MAQDLLNMMLLDVDDEISVDDLFHPFGIPIREPDFFTRLYEGYYYSPEIEYPDDDGTLMEIDYDGDNVVHFDFIDWDELEEFEEYVNSRENSESRKQIIDSLPIHEVNNTDETCAICMDDYKVKPKSIKLPCQHFYHQDCIYKWLLEHDSCPICRCNIIPK